MGERGEVVGIDLGTTYSSIAVPERGSVDLATVDGTRILPSVVGHEEGYGFVVGPRALNRLVFDPEGTVRSVKRAMGTDRIFRIGGREHRPEEVSARILGRLMDGVESSLGVRPKRAVITIPAYFDQAQRQATRRAGELAGLEVLRLVHEPTAAALTHRTGGSSRQVLVYDLGGGTFDASLVRQDGDLLEVVSTHGDTHLGGDDFDRRLAELALELHAEGDEAKADRIRSDPTAWTRLLLEAEAAKRRLSADVETTLRVEFLAGGEHLEIRIERAAYAERIRDLLDKTLDSIERVLSDARAGIDDVDEILLVGGSTRTPAVWHLLHEAYGKEPSRAVHPDEAVALGAGIEAGMLAGIDTGRVLVDVCAFSIGVGVLDLDGLEPCMRTSTIIPRNSPIPSRHVEVFRGVHPDQREARLFFFQGGDVDPRRNRCVGKADLEGMARREGERVPRVRIALEHDLDGVVHVRLLDGTGARAEGRFRPEASATSELMREFLHQCEVDDILPGPYGGEDEDFARAVPVEAVPAASAPEDRPAAAEARADLATLLEGLPAIAARNPGRAAEVEAASRRAREALRTGAALVEARDAIGDLLFELGEFV